MIPTGIELRLSNPAPFETFGFGLTYRDGILIVDSDLAAYVFKRNSSGVWTQRQRITPSGPRWYEDGTLAIVASGAVNIYQPDDAGKFTVRQKLVSPDSAPNDSLGGVSMAGPTMVVGGNGRAYVFRRNSTGVWRHRQTLIASELGTEEGARAGFGSAVAIDRGMIIVGAPGLDRREGDMFAKGAAYGFILDGSSYVEIFKLQARLDGYSDGPFSFGQQIAMFAERIVVGAYSSSSMVAPLNATSSRVRSSAIRAQVRACCRGALPLRPAPAIPWLLQTSVFWWAHRVSILASPRRAEGPCSA